MRFSLLIITIISLLGQACEKKIEDENLPEHQKGFAVEAFLKEGEPAQVFVDKSVPIEEPTKTIDNGEASVTLHKNGNAVTNMEYKKDGFYTASTPIKSGNSYTVKVNGESLPVAKGSTRVPEQIKLDTLKLNDSADQTPNTEILHALTFSFEDPAGQVDYYSFEGIMTNGSKPERIDLTNFDVSIDFSFQDASYMTDSDFDGEQVSFTVFIDGEAHTPTEVRKNLVFNFKHVSESMYHYMKSLDQQAEAGGSGPFSGEPALSEGNVENGYGCVGAVAVDSAGLQ